MAGILRTSFLTRQAVDGPDDNPEIIHWAQDLGGDVAKEYTNESIPWCGLFMATCLHLRGRRPPFALCLPQNCCTCHSISAAPSTVVSSEEAAGPFQFPRLCAPVGACP